ncbi:hypothetical protein SEA_ERLA_61 [Microbacterium phage Erla]|uniref:Uncharacterized protein n=18 Tax=Ilzatvirus TaxID=2560150 RepID=A0A7T0Q5R0_9CAUD|nr:hypothetical protein PBI_AUBERGINE_61 [Microbacterium phage Aubergine]AUX82835.1 hypothetical protein PBI_ESPINOSA_61 [Microbacterium phage Espinosa]AUX82960.1 hypothetical protein PBI_KALE_61 [Microbacterium phage Kale]AUX83338.1 hypothetical protein PBI_SUPERFRESH_62 [Microbacterium phage Superfresh]AUX83463.1 hypothetical protein PBI_TENDA_61 [Microbacterium phage Tenda]AVR56604.1 hypothetical protein PBI_TEDDYBEAR_61 [Microbacterium phage TeddyBear]AWN03839.1 hypothetical protein PBI_O
MVPAAHSGDRSQLQENSMAESWTVKQKHPDCSHCEDAAEAGIRYANEAGRDLASWYVYQSREGGATIQHEATVIRQS